MINSKWVRGRLLAICIPPCSISMHANHALLRSFTLAAPKDVHPPAGGVCSSISVLLGAQIFNLILTNNNILNVCAMKILLIPRVTA